MAVTRDRLEDHLLVGNEILGNDDLLDLERAVMVLNKLIVALGVRL